MAHLGSAVTGMLAWWFMRVDYFIDMIEDFPLDQRRRMGLEEFEANLHDSFKKLMKPSQNKRQGLI